MNITSIPGQIFINETRNGVPGWLATCQDLPDANCTDFQLSAIAVQTLKVVAADPTRPFAMFVTNSVAPHLSLSLFVELTRRNPFQLCTLQVGRLPQAASLLGRPAAVPGPVPY